MTVCSHFLTPLSPVLAMIFGGTLLIGLECLPTSGGKAFKHWVAVASSLVSVYFSISLYKAWPLALSSQELTSSAGNAWLIEFIRSYHLDLTTLGFFGAIAIFTALALVFMRMQFSKSDVETEVYALTLYIASGMMILISADTLLMVFLGLELMSLPTYVLVGLRRRDRNSCEAALKYFLFGSFATVLLVFGIAFLYARFGTLSLPRIANAIAELSTNPSGDNRLAIAGMVLLLIAVGFKVGLVPFHMWVPDAYQGAPSTVTGFMGSAIKLAGFGLAIRVMWGMFLPLIAQWSHLLSLLAIVTMFVGNLAAIAQDNLKRMFAYSSISHAGFLMLGICSVPPAGPNAAAIYYYLVVYGLMFLGLFGVLTLVERATRSTEIAQVSGMGFTHPLLALCLAIFSLSGAGIPPTAGFFAKYFIFLEAAQSGNTMLVVLALLASLMGVYYYLRVVVYLYMKEGRETLRINLKQEPLATACIIACAAALFFFAVAPGILK